MIIKKIQLPDTSDTNNENQSSELKTVENLV